MDHHQDLHDEEEDFYQDVMNAIQAWCLRWLQLQQETFAFLATTSEGARPMSMRNIDGKGSLQAQEEQDRDINSTTPAKTMIIPIGAETRDANIESLSTILKAIWIKHMDDEYDQPRKRQLQKQQSIDCLQETGVGSLDHLNGLTLEQLKEMQRLVHEHDSNSCYGSATSNQEEDSLLPLCWLDYICS